MAEHGGYEQTNKRMLDTFKNLSDAKNLRLSCIDPSDENSEKASEIFERFDTLAKHLYPLLVHLKSQKRRSVEETERLLLNFFDAWDTTFPFVAYINKMHFLMEHVIEFVEEYGVFGRFSAESHESVHARFERMMASVRSMPSTRSVLKRSLLVRRLISRMGSSRSRKNATKR